MPRERLVPSDNEIVPDPRGQTNRELPKIQPELAMLDYSPVGDRLALLNASNLDRERLLARVIIHGGLVDSNGKLVGVGEPISQRILANGVQTLKPIS